MNKLIWINEKELNYEDKFISKIKGKKKITGLWACGRHIKPITFENENIVINWSYEFNKVEFYMSNEYIKNFLEYYFYFMYYGEWGEVEEKPIIFMEVFAENFYKKSIKPLKVRDLFKNIKSKKEIKIQIYFEPTIQMDPESEYYRSGHNMWISNLGGLYDIVDPYWELNNKPSIKYENEKIFNYKIKKYIDWIDFEKIYLETAITAKELKKEKMKWEKFKFNYSDKPTL